MNPDQFAIHQRQRAKRTAQTPAEYAIALHGYRPRTRWAPRLTVAAIVLLVVATAALRLA